MLHKLLVFTYQIPVYFNNQPKVHLYPFKHSPMIFLWTVSSPSSGRFMESRHIGTTSEAAVCRGCNLRHPFKWWRLDFKSENSYTPLKINGWNLRIRAPPGKGKSSSQSHHFQIPAVKSSGFWGCFWLVSEWRTSQSHVDSYLRDS